MTSDLNRICVTGGAGYVGAMLVPRLLEEGRTVIHLMMYGEHVLKPHPRLTTIKGDIRDAALLNKTIPG